MSLADNNTVCTGEEYVKALLKINESPAAYEVLDILYNRHHELTPSSLINEFTHREYEQTIRLLQEFVALEEMGLVSRIPRGEREPVLELSSKAMHLYKTNSYIKRTLLEPIIKELSEIHKKDMTEAVRKKYLEALRST